MVTTTTTENLVVTAPASRCGSCECPGGLRRLRGGGDILALAHTVVVNQWMHAAPFHYFSLEPDEIDGLNSRNDC